MQIIPKYLNTNFEKGRGGKHPELIVIHIIGLPGITAESAYAHFSNPASEVSAHYIIKRTGEIWQCVKDEDTAWANGSISYKGGVPILPTNPIAKRAYQTGVRINQIALSVENEGSEYDNLTPVQEQANIFLLKELSRKFNIPLDSTHVCGHREIKKDKVCPGAISVGRLINLANAPIEVPIKPANIVINPPLTSPPPMPSWMENLVWRTKQTFGFGLTFGAARSPRWREIRRVHLMQFPACAVCGKKGKLFKANEAHHIVPVHIDKSKEENFDNLITLCKTHHLDFGHLGSFHSFNEAVAEDAALWRKKRQERP